MSELQDLLEELVAIESVNPGLAAGARGEGAIAEFVADWSERAGLEVEVSQPVLGRPNVVATKRGTGAGRTLLLNAHTDTVGVDAMNGGTRTADCERPALRPRRL